MKYGITCIAGIHSQYTRAGLRKRNHEVNEEAVKRIVSTGVSIDKLTKHIGISRSAMAFLLRADYQPYTIDGEMHKPARRLCEAIGANAWELWKAAKKWENIPIGKGDNVYCTPSEASWKSDDIMWKYIRVLLKKYWLLDADTTKRFPSLSYQSRLKSFRRNFDVIKRIYDNVNGKLTQNQVAVELGFTREWIRTSHDKALLILKKYVFSQYSSSPEIIAYLRYKLYSR